MIKIWAHNLQKISRLEKNIAAMNHDCLARYRDLKSKLNFMKSLCWPLLTFRTFKRIKNKPTIIFALKIDIDLALTRMLRKTIFFPSEKGLEKHALICGKSTISFWWDFCFSTLSPWGLCIFLSVLVRLSSWIKKSCGLLERSVSVWDREIRSERSNF